MNDSFSVHIEDVSLNDSFSVNIEDISLNDSYFFNKLNLQLQNIDSNHLFHEKVVVHNNYDMLNTPMFVSQNNSDNGSEDDDKLSDDKLSDTRNSIVPCSVPCSVPSPRSEYQIHNEIIEAKKNQNSQYKKLTFQEVEKSIEKYYDYDTKYSNEFDLLITYLNGQKNLFIQSQKITQNKLNFLILPSLFMSATVTLFLPISYEIGYWWTPIFVSILNAAITLLISFVNHYKLESKQELFGYFAVQYEQLQTQMELKNNQLLFFEKKNQKQYVRKEIQKLEKKINQLKNSSTVLIPEELNQLFPVIYHINIFSVIKKIENYRTDLIHKLCDVKNEIRYILLKKNISTKEQTRLNLLINTKEKIRKDIVTYKNSYYDIDCIFNNEIAFAESYRTLFLLFSCFFAKKKQYNDLQNSNEIIHKFNNF